MTERRMSGWMNEYVSETERKEKWTKLINYKMKNNVIKTLNSSAYKQKSLFKTNTFSFKHTFNTWARNEAIEYMK